ncbi:universal stress protein [Secundilactobacillus sp. HBUAS58055]|uniref:universal stress protein n=1 Tax=Secundilactobacillus angelensis TaxID=2722706 RepID=UPI001E3711A7|nr:universal stress protein [Secundilactobacillus angelensis]MCH5463248.1 universal stress protein [Secundilactobacillus angelensis]
MAQLSNYQNVMVGVDGSKQAKRAVQKAIAIAKRNQSKLYIVSVLNVSKLTNLGKAQFGFGAVDPDVLDEFKLKMDRLVAGYRDQATKAGINQVEIHVTFGHSKTELAKNLPQLLGIDLIVIGATGVNVVERMMMGSTATYVVANAQADVLIVRTDLDNQPLDQL